VDAAAGSMLVWTWRLLLPLSASGTSSHATAESPGRANTDLMLLGGSIVSLAAVGLVLVRASHETGLDKGLLVALSVASIVLAWSTVHTVLHAALRASVLQQREGSRRRLQRLHTAQLHRLRVPVVDDRNDVPGL